MITVKEMWGKWETLKHGKHNQIVHGNRYGQSANLTLDRARKLRQAGKLGDYTKRSRERSGTVPAKDRPKKPKKPKVAKRSDLSRGMGIKGKYSNDYIGKIDKVTDKSVTVLIYGGASRAKKYRYTLSQDGSYSRQGQKIMIDNGNNVIIE